MYFTLVSSIGYESKFKPLKFELQNWNQSWNPTQTVLPKSWNSVCEFIFGGFIKMYFINKIVQILASFVSTKFVLCNGVIGWKVYLINHH